MASVLASPDFLRVPKMFGLARTLALPNGRFSNRLLGSLDVLFLGNGAVRNLDQLNYEQRLPRHVRSLRGWARARPSPSCAGNEA